MGQNGLKWPFWGVTWPFFWIFEFSQISQYHEVMGTPKLHYIYKNWKNLSSRSTRPKDHVFLGQMLKKPSIPSVFNPLIENRKRFPIKEFQPFLQGIYIFTINCIVRLVFDIPAINSTFFLTFGWENGLLSSKNP